jgi:hypothetical protein
VPTKDELFLFLNKRNFLTTSLGARQTHTSYIIHVSEILMLNAIYHYYDVSDEINSLYDLLQTSYLIITFMFLFSFNLTTTYLQSLRFDTLTLTLSYKNSFYYE